MATAIRTSIGFVFSATMALLGGCNNSDDPSTSTATPSATIGTGVISTVRDAPTISGSPVTSVVAGTAYSFTPTATDPAGATLTYSIRNMPGWAKFDTSSGTLSGVAQQASVGIYRGVAISATNGSTVVTLPIFAISVTNSAAAAEPALSIAGTPAASVSVGAPYSFRPTTADSADAKLTFTIVNKPSWATFDSTTGALSGTPGSSNVGVTSAIAITATDGAHTASLTAFSVTVRSASAESVTLSWTLPTSNADGSPAMDLSGYHIYYGTSEQSMNKVVTVSGATETKQVVNGLAAGTWYFAVTSFNTLKVESKLSVIVPVTL
jgi:Putative Ig domain